MFASQMSRLHKRDVSARASISGSQAGGYYFVAMLFDRWSGEWHAHCCTDGIPNYPQTCVLSSGHLLRIWPLLQVKQEPSGAREENKIPDLVYLYNSKNLRCVQFIQFSSVQLLSRVQLFASPWTVACQAYLSITNSQRLLKLMSIKLVMPSNHLILCCLFSSCLQSFSASGSFPMSQFFALCGQNNESKVQCHKEQLLHRNLEC